MTNVPAPVTKRQTIVQQGTHSWPFDGTLPLSITPARNSSLTLTQGSTSIVLPTSAALSIAYKGSWPSDPPPPPPPLLGPPVDPTGVTIPLKPPKGAPFAFPLYGSRGVRVTDHATDIPGSQFFRNDYSRRYPFNSDETMMFGYIGGGPWAVYKTTGDSWTYLKTLTGVGPDSEVQWDVSDPDKLWFVDNNGGTKLYKLSVASNSVVDTIDLTAQLHALWPDANRLWTKSEGSPSKDGRYWGFMAETSSFDPRGYVVVDTQTRSIVWSMPNSERPDHVSMSPCGRWFIRSGGTGGGTYVHGVAPDVLGVTKQVHHLSEHSDSGVLASGHSFYISVDYQTNDGDVFFCDLEDNSVQTVEHPEQFRTRNVPKWVGIPGTQRRRRVTAAAAEARPVAPSFVSITRHVVDTAYHNAADPGQYSMHFSAKPYGKPGWAVEGRYGDDAHALNIVLLDLNTGQKYGVGLNYPLFDSYWDEPHGCPNRSLTKIVTNANYRSSGNVDVVLINV